MLNIIQNTIGAIRRVGESVVRAGLKMWLPFTKTEPLGEDLVTNGDFATDSDWSYGSGWDIDVVNNKAVYDGTGQQYGVLYQVLNTVIGKTYKMTFTLSGLSGGSVNFGYGTGQPSFISQQTFSSDGTYTIIIVASLTDHAVLIQNNVASQTFSIDNVSVEEYAQETPDISGNDNNAILKTGKCLTFTGNDSVQTAFPSSKDIKTIAFWIYPTHTSTDEVVFYFGDAAGGDKYIDLDHLVMESDANNNINFDVYIDGVLRGETNYGGNNPTLNINQWQRVVLTTDTAINTTNDKFYIAHRENGAFGRFNMSDLQIYGAEFTTDDIAYDYANPQKLVTDNASSNVTLNDLHAWWHMSEGDGTIAFDSAPLIGKELVVNGNFSQGESDWSFGDKWSIDNGAARLQSTDSDFSALLQSNVFEVGKTYEIVFDADVTTGTARFQGSGGVALITISETKRYSLTFTSATTSLIFQRVSSVSDLSIDNISVKEVYNIDGETYDGSSLGATYDDAQERIPQLGMMNWSKGSNVLTYSNDFQASSWSSAYVVFDYGYEAPDGTMTAWKLTRDGAQGFGAVYDQTVSVNVGVVRSIYAKTVSGTGNVHLMNNNGNANSLVTVTNEWQRFSATSGNIAAENFYAVDFRGSSTLTEVIIWGAQEEVNVGDSLSAFRKTDGTDVTNATLISCATDSQKDILGNAVRVKGSGFNLDGTGYGEVPHTTDFDFGTGDFSVSAWVKYGYVYQGSGVNVIFSNGLASASGSNNGFHLFSQADGIYCRVSNGTIVETIQIISNPTTDNWYHIAITRSGTDLNTYIDNVGTSQTISSIDVDSSFPLRIGVDRRSDRHYSYKIDDVILYDTELSSDEIEQNYKATKSGHNN